MSLENFFSCFFCGEHNHRDHAETKKHHRSILLREFVKWSVKWFSKLVQVSDDRKTYRSRRKLPPRIWEPFEENKKERHWQNEIEKHRHSWFDISVVDLVVVVVVKLICVLSEYCVIRRTIYRYFCTCMVLTLTKSKKIIRLKTLV